MNKKFLSAILFGALVASTGSFVSCADNDAEIKQLQDQNSDLKAQLAALKTELQAELKEAASASQVAAIEAKLSAIESATADNMKATVDALNGKFDTQEAKIVAINTQLKALEGLQGVDAKELVAALEKAKENAGADVNVLSAMVDALDEDVNVLKSALRSLVFQPEFYMDGIEAAEYTYLKYVPLADDGDVYVADGVKAVWNGAPVNKWINDGTAKNNLGNTVQILENFNWRYYHEGNIIAETPELNVLIGNGTLEDKYTATRYKDWSGAWKQNGPIYVGVRDSIKFAINPSNAKIDEAALNMISQNICALTRAGENNIQNVKISSIKNGILTVSYEVKNIKDIITAGKGNDEAGNKEQNHDKYDASGNVKETIGGSEVLNNQEINTTIVKLQAGVDNGVNVESDWAALYETEIQPVAFGVVQGSPVLKNAMLDGCDDNHLPVYKKDQWGNDTSEVDHYTKPAISEYWKNPYIALKATPTFEVPYNGSIDLAKYVNVHLLKRDVSERHKDVQDSNLNARGRHTEMTLAEVAARYGLTAEFCAVPYATEIVDLDGGNFTEPSKYVNVEVDGKTTARTVNEKGEPIADQNVSSIGKQPLVQVLLKDAEGNIVLDAYIHLIITRQIETVTIDPIKLGEKDFTCAGAQWKETWAQVSKLFSDDPKVNMPKPELDTYYELVMDADHTTEVAQFTAAGVPVADAQRYVHLSVNKDKEGTAWDCIVVDANSIAQQYIYEFEKHTATVYVKFIPKGGVTGNQTSMNNILVPFEITVKDYPAYALGNKIPEYWYAKDGTPTVTPDEAIRFNVNYPKDNGSTKSFVSQIDEAWEGNTAKFFNPGQTSWADAINKDWIQQYHWYYFHPATNNVQIVNEYNGKTYTLWVANKDPYSGAVVEMTEANQNLKLDAIYNGNYVQYNQWNKYDSYCVAMETKVYGHSADAKKPGAWDNISDKGIDEAIEFTQGLESEYKLDALAGMYQNVVLMATEGEYNKDHADWAHSAVVATIKADARETVDAKYDISKEGEITYANNEIAKNVLNAITHATATQKAYVGVAKVKESCNMIDNVAEDVFPVFFIRPIDIVAREAEDVTDAVANGEFVSVFDKFSFVDFRDVPFGAGQDVKNIWLAAYYNINAVKIDINGAMTTLGTKEGEEAKWSKLGDISTKVKLTYVKENKTTEATDNTITINMDAYDKASMGVQSTLDTFLKHFGYIKYENNGTNVADFQVKFPVYVTYEWGTVKTEFTVKFKGTLANS